MGECVCPGARSVDRAAFGRSMSCLVVWGFCRVGAVRGYGQPVLSCGCLSASTYLVGGRCWLRPAPFFPVDACLHLLTLAGLRGGAGYGRPALFPVGASVPTARPLKAG